MPIECDGRRNIPYPLDTMIDIQIEDGTIFYGLMRGDVCVDEKKPDPLRFGYFDMELSAYMERWFGVVTHYRLHERKGNEQG